MPSGLNRNPRACSLGCANRSLRAIKPTTSGPSSEPAGVFWSVPLRNGGGSGGEPGGWYWPRPSPRGTGFNRDDFCLASVPGMGSGPSLCPEKSRRVRGRRLNETGSCPERDLDPGYSRNVAHSRERVCALLGRRKSTGCRQRLRASWAHTAVPGPLTSVGNSPAINSGSICGWSAAYKVLQIQGGIGEFRIPYELLGPANRWRSSTGWGPGT